VWVKPATVALREVCWDLCHLQSDFAYQQGPQWPPGHHGTLALQLVHILCIHNLQATGHERFEGCQWALSRNLDWTCLCPSAHTSMRFLLGIAVMTHPPHLRSCRRVKRGNSAASTRCDSIATSVMWQMQFHVSKGSKLGCPICVSATSAFGAHGLKNNFFFKFESVY